MSKEIIAALIGATAVIVAALIGLLKKDKPTYKIKQSTKGNNNIQIGVDNSSHDGGKNE